MTSKFFTNLLGMALVVGGCEHPQTSGLEKAEMTASENYWEGKGRALKGKIKQKWGFLTDDVFLESQGRKDYVAGKIQEKTGINQKRAIEEIKALENQPD